MILFTKSGENQYYSHMYKFSSVEKADQKEVGKKKSKDGEKDKARPGLPHSGRMSADFASSLQMFADGNYAWFSEQLFLISCTLLIFILNTLHG